MSLSVNILGQESCKQLFVHLLKNILKARGANVGHQQLCTFLDFVRFS